jgi:hypothetical protein
MSTQIPQTSQSTQPNQPSSSRKENFQLVPEKVALAVPRFPSYERCPAHLGHEVGWQEAEQVTRLIKALYPQRVVVERYAFTTCPHKECPHRIVQSDLKNSETPSKTRVYCTYLDIVVKAAEAKKGRGFF